jgi:hypothetical protein
VTGGGQTFRFRRAALLPRRTYALDGHVLRCEGRWELDLRSIDRAAFVDNRFERLRVVRFDLICRGRFRTKVRRLNQTRDLGWAPGPDAAAYSALVQATARRLATLNPALEVTMGEYGAARWGVFVPMLLWFAGMGSAGWFFQTMPVDGPTYLVAIPFWIAATAGLVSAWRFRPMKANPVLPIGVFADVLEEAAAESR